MTENVTVSLPPDSVHFLLCPLSTDAQAPRVSMTSETQGEGGGDSGKWNFLFNSLIYLENVSPFF